jgi:hypothetical protein
MRVFGLIWFGQSVEEEVPDAIRDAVGSKA